MQYSKGHLAVRHAAAKDRFNLKGVRFNGNGEAVATDGHMLIRFTPADAPEGEPLAPFTLPTVTVTDAKRAAKGAPVSLDVEAANLNGSATLAAANGATFTGEKLDGDYPDYEKVIPKDAPLAFRMNLKLLERVVKAAKEAKPGSNMPLFADFYVTDQLSPVRIDMETPDGTLTAVIMPARKE